MLFHTLSLQSEIINLAPSSLTSSTLLQDSKQPSSLCWTCPSGSICLHTRSHERKRQANTQIGRANTSGTPVRTQIVIAFPLPHFRASSRPSPRDRAVGADAMFCRRSGSLYRNVECLHACKAARDARESRHPVFVLSHLTSSPAFIVMISGWLMFMKWRDGRVFCTKHH